METAMRLSDARSHAVVDCIPVPPAVTAKAPLYFKKGIDDAESEWSQHHAKRMIETGGKVGACCMIRLCPACSSIIADCCHWIRTWPIW